MKKNNFICTK